MKMSKKSLKIVLILVTILSLISTFSLATDTSADAANTPVTTSEDTATTNETVEGTEGETSTESTPTTDNTSTSTEASTNTDIYLIEDEVNISEAETVNGNVFVIADTVTIKGLIGGDLFVIANTLNIEGGQVYGNVFAMVNDISLNGLIYDLYANCNTLNMPYDGVAYRDLKVNCKSATIEGIVGKNVIINATDKLSLKADAVIHGDLNLTSPNEVEIISIDHAGNTVEEKTAKDLVTGTVNYEKANNILDYVVSLLTALVYTLIIWLLLSKFTKKFYGKVTEMKPKKMLLAIVVGLVSIIAVPLVAMLLILTVVGVPVAFALLAIYTLVISIAFALISIVLANKLAAKVKPLAKFNNLFAVIIVAIVLWALTLIPYAGGIITLLVTFSGFGMVVLTLKNKKEKKAETPAEKAE